MREPRVFFDYWKESSLDALIEREETLDYAFGKTFRESGIEAGDTVWILSSRSYQALWVAGAIEVSQGVLSQAEALRELGRTRITGDAAAQYITNARAGRDRVVKRAIFGLGERMEFLTLAGEPTTPLPMDRIRAGLARFGNSLQSCRRLTPATHRLLWDATYTRH
jgi:hypothetical protein